MKNFRSFCAYVLIVVCPFIGFTQAYMSSLAHTVGVAPQCHSSNCDEVITNPLSYVSGIPISFFGIAYYLVQIVLAQGILRYNWAAKWGNLLSLAGVFVSGLLVYMLRYRLEMTCERCMISALASAGSLLGYGLLSETALFTRRSLSWLRVALPVACVLFVSVSAVMATQEAVQRKYGFTEIKLSTEHLKELRESPIVYTRDGAKRTVAVFADPLCGECHVQIETLKQRVDAGEAFGVVVHLVALSPNSPSRDLAIALNSLPSERFWHYFDLLNKRESKGELALRTLWEQMKQEPKTMDSDLAQQVFERDKKLGDAAKMEGTPHLILVDGASSKILSSIPLNGAY